MLRIAFALSVSALITASLPGSHVHAQERSGAAKSLEISAQQRREPRRAPTRLRVTPLPQQGPLRRECVAVFEERYVPQWRQRVIYPGQQCWWTRG